MSVQSAAIAGPSSYVDILHDAWQQHLVPRAPDAPIVISLFAGCGGSSLGYSMAGYREVLAVERDPMACATFRMNFPDVPLYAGNIEDLTAEACLAQSGMAPGQLDVLDGSPPCQGFSTAGKRQMADARNTLFREYVRLLEALQPKAFVMENVSGLVKGKMKLLFADSMQLLKNAGYHVRTWLMNAKYFSVPQDRARLIFLGVRADVALVPTLIPLARHLVSSASALATVDVNNVDELMNRVHPGQRATVALAQAGEQLSKYHPRGYWFNYFKIRRNAPCQTLPKSCHDKVFHYAENRCLSLDELKVLSSFPLPFDVVGTYEETWHQIGNAVPPLFMRAIAQHVRTMLAEASCHAVA